MRPIRLSAYSTLFSTIFLNLFAQSSFAQSINCSVIPRLIEEEELTTTGFSSSSVLGDLSRDGNLDLIFGTLAETPNVLFSNGGTLTASEVPLPLDDLELGVNSTLFDANGDGHLDLWVGTSDFLDIPSIFFADGLGSFSDLPTGLISDPVGFYSELVPTLINDIDGDGQIDLLSFDDEQGCVKLSKSSESFI